MFKPSRQSWRTGLTTYGPRVLVAGALSGAVAFMAPGQDTLGTDRAHAGHGRIDIPEIGRNFKQPLSISGVLGHSPSLPSTQAVRLASAAASGSIPGPAFAAYQRAATALQHARQACRIDWELIAAIGMVESNHGRFGGSALDQKGVARPPIIGPELNGAGDVARVVDTDKGLYDHDTAFDRAVGPMQFLPGTWNTINADGDGDKRRDPQDIDDAALASGAYLCAGGEDLSTEAGQRAAVFRYNHSRAYVDAVMSVAEKYRHGDFAGAVVNPGGSIGNFPGTDIRRPGTQVDADGPLGTPPSGATHRAAPGGSGGSGGGSSPGGSGGSRGGGTPPAAENGGSGAGTGNDGGSTPAPTQTQTQATAPASTQAADPASGNSGSGSGSSTSGSSPSGSSTGSTTPTTTPTPTPSPSPTPTASKDACDAAVTSAYPDATTEAHDEAVELCTSGASSDADAEDWVRASDDVAEIDGIGEQSPATADSPSDGQSTTTTPEADPSGSTAPSAESTTGTGE